MLSQRVIVVSVRLAIGIQTFEPSILPGKVGHRSHDDVAQHSRRINVSKYEIQS
jgi:hypothetical protein